MNNEVMGFPEIAFRQAWIEILSKAMLKSGKGWRVDSAKRRPRPGASKWRGERRSDKVGTTKTSRFVMVNA